MLYVVPASSAFHSDSHLHCFRGAFVPRYVDYHGHYPSDIAQTVLEALWRYDREQHLLRRHQAEEVACRRLYESTYAAKQRALTHHRQQQQMEVEYALAVAIEAAQRRRAEEPICHEQAAKAHLRQQELSEYQNGLLASLYHGGARQTDQPKPVPARPTPDFRTVQPIPRSNPFNLVAEKLDTRLRGERDPESVNTVRGIIETLFPNQSQATAPDSNQPTAHQDKGKGKARAGEVVGPKPDPEINDFEKVVREYLKDFFRPVPRPSEAGSSGTSSTEPAQKKEKHVSFEEKPSTQTPPVSASTPKPSVPAAPEQVTAEPEPEATERARTQALSTIQQIQTSLNTLEAEFQLPATLNHYSPTTLDHDDTASVSSTASDLSRLLPYTANNASVHAYENSLGKLLERLDGVESGGDLDVREARREVVRGIEKALGAVESIIESEIAKRVEPAGGSVPVLESQSEEMAEYSIGDTTVPEAGIQVPSAPSAFEIPITVAEKASPQLIDIKPMSNQHSVDTPNVTGNDEKPASASEPLSVLPSEAADETLPPSLPSDQPSGHLTQSASHGVQANSQNILTVTEAPTSPEVSVDEIDTFLLRSSRPVLPAIENRANSDEAEDEADGVVVVDAERSADEWFEIEA